jgi:hypothetical protein
LESDEKKSSLNFILHASRLVVMSRSAISICYAKRHTIEESDHQHFFDGLVAQLEFYTEKLQKETEKDWTRHT